MTLTAFTTYPVNETAAALFVTTVLVVIYFLMIRLKDIEAAKRNPRTNIVRMAEALMQDFCEHPSWDGYTNCVEFMEIHQIKMGEVNKDTLARYIMIARAGSELEPMIPSQA